MRSRFLALAFIFIASSISIQSQVEVTVSVVARGLYHPLGMALLPDGGLLIAEAGNRKDDWSAGVSLLTADGALGRLISGFPGGRVLGDLLASLPLAVSPDGSTIYVGHFNAQRLYTLAAGQAAELPEMPFLPHELGSAMAGMNNVFFLHPFDITFDAAGSPLVSDALSNSLVIAGEHDARQLFHQFGDLDMPNHPKGRLEAVPRGLTRLGDDYYVALFGGCPHAVNSGELVALNADRKQRTVVDSLNLPIDVAVDAAGNIWILEFATVVPNAPCFSYSSFQGHSGRLSRIRTDGMFETVVENLDFPGAVLPLPDGSLYISEVFAGRILHIQFDAEPPAIKRFPPLAATGDAPSASDVAIHDADAILRDVIDRYQLSAYPGRERIEADSELTQLGRDLFFDPILSGDENISCATCHHPAFAMTDGRVLPIGAGGIGLGAERFFDSRIPRKSNTHHEFMDDTSSPLIGHFIPRNSQTILNSALLRVQFWDGRVEKYDETDTVQTQEEAVNALGLTDLLLAQALFPMTSEREMAGVSLGDKRPAAIRDILVKRLQNNALYAARFESVFGRGEIEPLHVAKAIAAFERQLILTDSPWDDYIAGDSGALSKQQKRGALLFFGALNPTMNCASCHSGDLFTDQKFYNLLIPQIGPGKENGASGLEDFGRANVSFDYRDQYKFRTPGLRNIELTAPYFHSGAYQTLRDAVWHHADVWTANMVYDAQTHLPPAFHGQLLPHNFEAQTHSLAPQLAVSLPLNEEDVTDLVAFMRSLTDPAARDLSHLLPTEVPSGLPLDPLPTES